MLDLKNISLCWQSNGRDQSQLQGAFIQHTVKLFNQSLGSKHRLCTLAMKLISRQIQLRNVKCDILNVGRIQRARGAYVPLQDLKKHTHILHRFSAVLALALHSRNTCRELASK